MNTKPIDTLPYPRRRVARFVLRGAARLLIALLTRLKVLGMENFPRSGPLILAGNHVGVMEAVLMAALSPRQVEFLGTGDIPFDPNYARIVEAYGLIPINRGNLDRDAIQKSVDVLRQGGVLGIFPEGGIWDPARMEAQLGVALISQRANAPVLPIGFGGMRGALVNALKLKRPRLEMRVGELIPPATTPDQRGPAAGFAGIRQHRAPAHYRTYPDSGIGGPAGSSGIRASAGPRQPAPRRLPPSRA
jgi:1-acyl-sn-glycerol-3-phosphate acyltransferase